MRMSPPTYMHVKHNNQLGFKQVYGEVILRTEEDDAIEPEKHRGSLVTCAYL